MGLYAGLDLHAPLIGDWGIGIGALLLLRKAG